MNQNRLRIDALWENDRPAFGGWVTIDSALVLEAMVAAGCDYVGLDCQHTMLDENDAARLLRPLVDTEIATFVRVAANDPARIGLVLDAGADGVIVPMVSTAAEAEAAVAACRYPPHGVRSFGPQHRSLGASPAGIAARARCFVMIETEQGVAELDSICAVEGVAGTYVGPVDLAIGLGLENPFQSPPPAVLTEAIARVAAASRAAGIVGGIHATSAALAATLADRGYRLLSLRADFMQLGDAVRSDLAGARGEQPSPTTERIYR